MEWKGLEMHNRVHSPSENMPRLLQHMNRYPWGSIANRNHGRWLRARIGFEARTPKTHTDLALVSPTVLSVLGDRYTL